MTALSRADESALDLIWREARTFSHFLDKPVGDDNLQAAYDLSKMGPTSANSQPLRILFVRGKEAKAKLEPALSAGNRAKTMAAPVTAVFAQDTGIHGVDSPQRHPAAAKFAVIVLSGGAIATNRQSFGCRGEYNRLCTLGDNAHWFGLCCLGCHWLRLAGREHPLGNNDRDIYRLWLCHQSLVLHRCFGHRCFIIFRFCSHQCWPGFWQFFLCFNTGARRLGLRCGSCCRSIHIADCCSGNGRLQGIFH